MPGAADFVRETRAAGAHDDSIPKLTPHGPTHLGTRIRIQESLCYRFFDMIFPV